MDEFFCPKCSAILNDQWSFNIYDDDHECLSCGAKLHHRYSDDEYSILYKCPKCDDTLNDQWSFNIYDDDHECLSCGAKLHHRYSDDEYSIAVECPNCGAMLNDQFCYVYYKDDWECTKCGAHLHRYYSFDPYEIVNDNDDSSGYSNRSSYVSPCYTPPPQSHTTSASCSKTEKKLSEKELCKQRVKAFFLKRKKIQIKYNYSDLLGQDIDNVETMLYNRGFTNIKKVLIQDIYIGSPYRVGQVEQVAINDSFTFRESDQLPYDSEIVVTYHVKRKISIPFDAKTLLKMNYVAARDKLQELGFTKIYEKPIQDLVTGWIKKGGAIEKITIGGICSFKKNGVFDYDTKITIEYHTFKKNNPFS